MIATRDLGVTPTRELLRNAFPDAPVLGLVESSQRLRGLESLWFLQNLAVGPQVKEDHFHSLIQGPAHPLPRQCGHTML